VELVDRIPLWVDLAGNLKFGVVPIYVIEHTDWLLPLLLPPHLVLHSKIVPVLLTYLLEFPSLSNASVFSSPSGSRFGFGSMVVLFFSSNSSIPSSARRCPHLHLPPNNTTTSNIEFAQTPLPSTRQRASNRFRG
jgi:hypothetical protein